MTDYTVDPTGPLTIGTIPDADLDRLIEATIPAPPLERFTTTEILASIARRPGGPAKLQALANDEPALQGPIAQALTLAADKLEQQRDEPPFM